MNNNEKQKGKLHIPYASRFDMMLYAALACANIAILAVLCKLIDIDSVFLALFVTLLYLLEISAIGLRRASDTKLLARKNIYELLLEEGSVVFKTSHDPIAIFDYHGIVLWYNDAMRMVHDKFDNYIDRNISELIGIDVKSVIKENVVATINDSIYSVEGFVISEGENGLYMVKLNDITKLTTTERKYNDERVAVAYIAIDNVEDVLQYVHEKIDDEISKIDDKLKSWAASMNGILKSYDNDKYIMFFDCYHLDKCIESRFSILDDIRDTRVGDGVSITVSIGVSKCEGSLLDRELDARDAVDLALQRGGDQVVYKSDEGIVYYGGRTRTVYKRSNVRARTFASQLTSLMARSENVIIMGHKYGDFDSFGSSIGVARLAAVSGVKANIAIDFRDKNLKPYIEMMQAIPEYERVFVDNAEGLDLIGPDTLVVLVDHSTVARAQFSDIAEKADTIAVVDHHRKIETLAETVKLSYIEPSASSASELVTEMLESVVSSQNLLKEEADLLLAGILLDTKQFTRNTGTRTFGAAQYLRGAGASPSDVYNLFKTAPEDLSKEARFHTSITVYRGNIAISCCEGETDDTYRIVASKAADKMLTLQNVDAAFALVRVGEQIHISGRSNGKVNVQLILEKLHGGGHFDVAGAQVVSNSVIEVLQTLKMAIDTYLEEQ